MEENDFLRDFFVLENNLIKIFLYGLHQATYINDFFSENYTRAWNAFPFLKPHFLKATKITLNSNLAKFSAFTCQFSNFVLITWDFSNQTILNFHFDCINTLCLFKLPNCPFARYKLSPSKTIIFNRTQKDIFKSDPD